MIFLDYAQPPLYSTMGPVLAGVVVYLVVTSIITRKHHSKISGRTPIPRSSANFFKTVKAVSGTEYPWFLLNTARDLKSSIFRLNLDLVFGRQIIAVGDPQTAHEILKDPLTTKPKALYGPFEELYLGNKSLATTNGMEWHSRRKGLAPAFSAKHIKRMNKVALDKVNEWIETRLSCFIEKDEGFDLGEEMIGIILTAICETAFEYDISDEDKKRYVKELEYCTKEFLFKSATNPLRKKLGFLFSERRRAQKAAEYVTGLSLKIMDSYRNLDNPVEDTIIDRIMKNPTYKTDMERAADVTLLLIAGHDTTAYTISWILRELAKNPAEQEKLWASLDLVGSDAWEKSSVLRNVVKEGMRLYPLVSGGSGRTIGRDVTTSKGHILPKGSIITLPFILSLRNSDVYENADSFIPSRWESATKEMNNAFYPFALGKQNCIGQSLANAEIHTIVPRICSEFKLELVDEGRPSYFLTLKPIKTIIKATKRI